MLLFVFLLLLYQFDRILAQTQGGGSYGSPQQPYGSPSMFSNLPPQYQQYAQTYQQYQHLLPEAQRRQYESYFQQLSSQNNPPQPNVNGAEGGYQYYAGNIRPVTTSYSGYSQPVQPLQPRLVGYPTEPGVFTPATSYVPGQVYSTNQFQYAGHNVVKPEVLTEDEYKTQRDRPPLTHSELTDYKASFQQDQKPGHVIPIPIQTVGTSGYPTGPPNYPSNTVTYQTNPVNYQNFNPLPIQPQVQYNRDCYPVYDGSKNYFYPQRNSFGPPPQVIAPPGAIILPSQQVVGPAQGYSSQPYVQSLPAVNPTSAVKIDDANESKAYPRPTTRNVFSNIEDEFEQFKKIDTGEYATGPIHTTTTPLPTTKVYINKLKTTTSGSTRGSESSTVGEDEELVEASSTSDIPLTSAEVKGEHWKPAVLNTEQSSKFPLPKSLHDYRQGNSKSQHRRKRSPQRITSTSLPLYSLHYTAFTSPPRLRHSRQGYSRFGPLYGNVYQQLPEAPIDTFNPGLLGGGYGNGYNGYGPPSYGRPMQPLGAGIGMNFGPTNQWGYGVNAGVYAGVNGNQGGYGNFPGSMMSGQPRSPLEGRPYGPTNTNIGGSYGGMSQWPFMPPSSLQTGNKTSPAVQPANTTIDKEHQGRVRQVPIKTLVNNAEGTQNDDKVSHTIY